jgi:hypothetical protein
MDLASLPSAALLRWDLAVRLILSVVLPVLVAILVTDGLPSTAFVVAMAAALVSFASLGPDVGSPPWLGVAAVGVPVAIVAGAISTGLAPSGTLLVFVLFTVHGAMMRAGLVAQLAWFPVSVAGMLSSLLISSSADLRAVALASVGGSVLAVLLAWLVPRLVHAPALPIPAEALVVDVDRLRRMVRSPHWRDWVFPLSLGLLSSGLLLVANALTGGFKPYWAVLAFVSVLGPTTAHVRREAGETVTASLLGVLLAGLVLTLGWGPTATMVLVIVLGVLGALLVLRNGLLSKALLTPLPVLLAAAALETNGVLALPARLAEYIAGAALAVVVAVLSERVVRALAQDRPGADIVG